MKRGLSLKGAITDAIPENEDNGSCASQVFNTSDTIVRGHRRTKKRPKSKAKNPNHLERKAAAKEAQQIRGAARNAKFSDGNLYDKPKLRYNPAQGTLCTFYVEFDTWQEYAYCNPGEYPYGWHNEDPDGADLLSCSGHI